MEAPAAAGCRCGRGDRGLPGRRSVAGSHFGEMTNDESRMTKESRSPTFEKKPMDATMADFPQPLDLSRLKVYPLAQRHSMSRVEEVLVEPSTQPAPCDDAAT